MMKLEEYLKILGKESSKKIQKKYPCSLLFASNSLGGECGELQNMIKKVYRDDNADPSGRLSDIMLELGDILWSWNRLCELLGVTPSEIMKLNLEKLQKRNWLS